MSAKDLCTLPFIEKLIEEKILPDLPKFTSPSVGFFSFATETDALVTKQISESDKIAELVKEKLIAHSGSRIHLTAHGRRVAEKILPELV